MKQIFTGLIIVLACLSCTENKKPQIDPSLKFTEELQEFKSYFQIPGIAAAIERDGKIIYQQGFGFSDLEQQTPVDSTTLFPVASLTKVFSGVLLMKLVEQEKLSLDTPVNTYLPEFGIPDAILIKHVLSHTSQGDIGEQFYYSSRFGLLTPILEEAGGKPFAQLMEEEILKPAKLEHTFLLNDSTQIGQQEFSFAKPYIIDDGVQEGFVDYGYSTAAGIVSNLQDMMRFNTALDNNTLISEASKKLMFTAVGPEIPYGYGIFNQEFNGVNMVWAYGQYDCYSSLLLKIPSEKITLTLFANNNLMSDPPRLIYGDVTNSLSALSFLKNYVFEYDDLLLIEGDGSSEDSRTMSPIFHRKMELAKALSASFMARFDPQELESSALLLNQVFSMYPEYLDYADLGLLHNLTFLKEVAFHLELGEFTTFDQKIEKISQKLLKEDPKNPYVHAYMGAYYDRRGNSEMARFHFSEIINAENFSRNWYTMEAENWLKGQAE